jgi:hypothetical protein
MGRIATVRLGKRVIDHALCRALRTRPHALVRRPRSRLVARVAQAMHDHLDAALSLGVPIEVALHQVAQQRGPSFASSFDTSPCSSLASGRERYSFAR